MSAYNDDSARDDKNPQVAYHQHNSSCMTPSIITTINNADPNCPVNNTSNNNGGNLTTKTKKTVEPYYESYIEDSFVGHWEREDDDFNDEFKANVEGTASNEPGEDEQALHPSTIEFDFDSFGPESFIYTPAGSNQTVVDKESATQNQPKSGEVKKPEQEPCQKEDNSNTVCNSSPKQCVLNSNSIDYLVDTAQIDLKVIEPYKKVISHAGYCHHFDPSAPAPKPGESAPAIIVFSACYLPDRSRRDYNYVMDHLFLYVLSSLHELIADDYILIYLHNTQPSILSGSTFSKTSSSSNIANGSSSSASSEELSTQNNLPTFTWMKRCYQMIDRRLRKNLKILYLVKPTFWLKTIVIMCKPFISTKFSKKLRFVEDMNGLKKCLPVDKLILPASAENI